jgi:hypothetical protein
MADKERGATDDQTRPAEAGETDMTRFGMEQSDAEEPSATGGPYPDDTSSDEETK